MFKLKSLKEKDKIELLNFEILALLHDIGKMDRRFIEGKMTGDFMQPETMFCHEITPFLTIERYPHLDYFLKNNIIENKSLYDFIISHHNRNSNYLKDKRNRKDILKIYDRFCSGYDKGFPETPVNFLIDPSGNIINKISYTSISDSHYVHRTFLYFDLLIKKLQYQYTGLSFYRNLRNSLFIRFRKNTGYLNIFPAETRFPANDITLFEHSYFIAMRGKTSLYCRKLNHVPDQNRPFAMIGIKLPDIIYKNMEFLKHYIIYYYESELLAGNLLWNKDNILVFSTMNDENKGFNASMISEIDKHIPDLETRISSPSKLFFEINDFINSFSTNKRNYIINKNYKYSLILHLQTRNWLNGYFMASRYWNQKYNYIISELKNCTEKDIINKILYLSNELTYKINPELIHRTFFEIREELIPSLKDKYTDIFDINDLPEVEKYTRSLVLFTPSPARYMAFMQRIKKFIDEIYFIIKNDSYIIRKDFDYLELSFNSSNPELILEKIKEIHRNFFPESYFLLPLYVYIINDNEKNNVQNICDIPKLAEILVIQKDRIILDFEENIEEINYPEIINEYDFFYVFYVYEPDNKIFLKAFFYDDNLNNFIIKTKNELKKGDKILYYPSYYRFISK